MRLLLDTHIWIWALNDGRRISQAVRRQIERVGNELYLSPISIWETSHLYRRGKLGLKISFREWLDSVLPQIAVLEAPISFDVIREASAIQLPQPDIADTFLAATARVFDLTLVTQDAQLLNCKWLKTLAND